MQVPICTQFTFVLPNDHYFFLYLFLPFLLDLLYVFLLFLSRIFYFFLSTSTLLQLLSPLPPPFASSFPSCFSKHVPRRLGPVDFLLHTHFYSRRKSMKEKSKEFFTAKRQHLSSQRTTQKCECYFGFETRSKQFYFSEV